MIKIFLLTKRALIAPLKLFKNMKIYLSFNFNFLVIPLLCLISCKQSIINKDQLNIKEYFIYCDSLDLVYMNDNYKYNDYIPILFTEGSQKRSAKMRVRGDSSRDYDKKSLKIKITDSLSINSKKVFNFNAEYTDLSSLRSFVSSKIFKELNYPCFSTSFAKVFINDKFHGLFIEVENMDKEFLKNNGLNTKGNLFKATRDGACLNSVEEIEKKWEKKTNKNNDFTPLAQLISDTKDLPDNEFYDFVLNNFHYTMLIDFLAINSFIANGSTYYHNYYLYQDFANNGKWIFLPWDLDKTLSYYNWKPYKYHRTSSDWEFDNPFIEKCFLNPKIFQDFIERINYLGKVIDKDFYKPIYNIAKNKLESYLLKDSTNKINSKEIWLDAIGRDISFLKNRSNDLVKQIYEMPLPFKVYKTVDEISLPFNLVWEKAADSLDVVYEVMLSKDFLFPDSTTYKYRTNKHFLTLQDNIPFNKYYWKVLAIKNENLTEGFNSKNKFLLKKGTILPKMIKGDLDLTLDGSPYRVANNTTIDSLSVVKIMPGVTVLIDENKEILCKGELNILGTKEKKVQIRPTSVNSYFNSIFFYNYSKGNIIHTNILDGLINSKRSNLKIENTNIFIKNRPMETDDKRSSIIWGWYGNMFLNNISLFGNQKGEGINISWASSATISNSSFYNTPDAIELINVNNGLISNNLVYYSADDAIDLNSCSNILIEKNTLINNADKAISIGVDWGNDFVTEHGRSKNINIINNIILGNNVGIAIKDSSEVYSSNNIVSYNNEGLKLYKKQEGYHLGGTMYSLNDQVNNNNIDFFKDEFSEFNKKGSVDSIYIRKNNNKFSIPSVLNLSLFKGQLSLINKSNFNFDLQGWALIGNNKNIHVFNKNELIKPNQNFILDTLKYETIKYLSLDDKFYLEDKESEYIYLLKNE